MQRLHCIYSTGDHLKPAVWPVDFKSAGPIDFLPLRSKNANWNINIAGRTLQPENPSCDQHNWPQKLSGGIARPERQLPSRSAACLQQDARRETGSTELHINPSTVYCAMQKAMDRPRRRAAAKLSDKSLVVLSLTRAFCWLLPAPVQRPESSRGCPGLKFAFLA